MSKYKTEVMVGVFVMLTIGALLLLALKVANQTVATEGDTYTLYAKFDNIGGLKPRSAVKVGGVTVTADLGSKGWWGNGWPCVIDYARPRRFYASG